MKIVYKLLCKIFGHNFDLWEMRRYPHTRHFCRRCGITTDKAWNL